MDLLLNDLSNDNEESSVELEVDHGFTVASGKFKKGYILYCLRIFSKIDYSIKIEVYRRYSDFEWLNKKLGNQFPGVSIPS